MELDLIPHFQQVLQHKHFLVVLVVVVVLQLVQVLVQLLELVVQLLEE